MISQMAFKKEKKKKELVEAEQMRGCWQQRGVGGRTDEGGEKVQTSNDKMNKLWRCNVQQGDFSCNTVLYSCLDLQRSQHTHTNCN